MLIIPYHQKEAICMRALQTETMRVLPPFAPPLSKSVWRHVQVLLAGASDAARSDAVGFPSLGPTVPPVGVGPLRALRQKARPAAQKARRVRLAVAGFGQALWHPECEIVAVAGYASLKLIDRCRRFKKKPIAFS